MKEKFEDSFENIKKINKDLRALGVRKIFFHKDPSEKLIGQNGFIMLHRLLRRSRTLLYSGINSIERKDLITLSLATRAHLETTGLLAYALKQFIRYYRKEITTEELDKKLKSIFLGSSENRIPDSPSPINTMTAIDSIDYFIKEFSADQKKFFREQYEVLSQYCHPNLPGTSYHSKIDMEAGELVFLKDEDSFRGQENSILLLELSGGYFYNCWKKLHVLLATNETLPNFEK